MLAHVPGLPPPIRQVTRESYNDSPFSNDISNTEVLKKLGYPSMKGYDSTSDSKDHIAQFKQRMFFASPPEFLHEACMCKGSRSTLSGPVLQWLINLPNGRHELIYPTAQCLCAAVCKQSQNGEKHGRSLRTYVTCFNVSRVEIPGCHELTGVAAFRKGLMVTS